MDKRRTAADSRLEIYGELGMKRDERLTLDFVGHTFVVMDTHEEKILYVRDRIRERFHSYVIFCNTADSVALVSSALLSPANDMKYNPFDTFLAGDEYKFPRRPRALVTNSDLRDERLFDDLRGNLVVNYDVPDDLATYYYRAARVHNRCSSKAVVNLVFKEELQKLMRYEELLRLEILPSRLIKLHIYWDDPPLEKGSLTQLQVAAGRVSMDEYRRFDETRGEERRREKAQRMEGRVSLKLPWSDIENLIVQPKARSKKVDTIEPPKRGSKKRKAVDTIEPPKRPRLLHSFLSWFGL
ncbi:ATP-dependent RNA helicase FAL1 [Selaginella moellendorffii]|uniref:ATP-dependent RNA helicase FAL1 n=1 Tax=Selaginella moellendorffii TaxID=88036 RepID=UPI000D1CEB06|nr:ATP-dependent RNA helicase FAL1 [Selaginella moellendorffii]|eukprot:XP_024514780.1 ATP-dependent RNA helicase FAL1 [Selaginella moellendorffii]